MTSVQFLLATLIFSPSAYAQKACLDLFRNQNAAIISKSEFLNSTNNVRKSMSGNFATVWRAEWKTKGGVDTGNSYVSSLIHELLTTATQARVLEGLNPKLEGFVRKVHKRLFELQEQRQLLPEDELLVRNAPPPDGTRDLTFTYYTNPIKDGAGEGKHQFRGRGYIREITFSNMKFEQAIEVYEFNGTKLNLSRLARDKYLIESFESEAHPTIQVLSLQEIESKFGRKGYFYPPHGKNIKLEVKTALEDNIQGPESLAGNHMVQKLDVGLSFSQVQALFAPLQGRTPAEKQRESLLRIEIMKQKLISKSPQMQNRIEEVLNVLSLGIRNNPDFLVIEGATLYDRTAFETKSGIQTTVDREQAVYDNLMYDKNGVLKLPSQVLLTNTPITAREQDARHVELKFPVYAVDAIMGIQYEGATAPPSAPPNFDAQKYRQAAQIFSTYVRNSDHSGKFNYLKRNGERTPSP